MKDTFNGIASIILLVLIIVPWLIGLVVAKGFWSTLFAFFPPYAWYLVTEHLMQMNGWI
jgi:hypothetical protein